MKTFLSLALLTIVGSSVQCGDLKITIESDTWCPKEKYFKDEPLQTYIEDNAHCSIANHLLLRNAKHGKELHKRDVEKILDYLRRENRQKKEDLKKAKKLNKKASALSSLVNNKPIKNKKNDCDTNIATYIKGQEIETLETYISEVKALDPISKEAVQRYINTLENERNTIKNNIKLKEFSVRVIERLITSRVKKDNSYCNGYCVTPPTPPCSCDEDDDFPSVFPLWAWTIFCPITSAVWGGKWLYRQAAHCLCPFQLHVYEEEE